MPTKALMLSVTASATRQTKICPGRILQRASRTFPILNVQSESLSLETELAILNQLRFSPCFGIKQFPKIETESPISWLVEILDRIWGGLPTPELSAWQSRAKGADAQEFPRKVEGKRSSS